MTARQAPGLSFTSETILARFTAPGGQPATRKIEVRTNPVTGRRCRITFSRSAENEPGTAQLPTPPPHWDDTHACPFCQPQVEKLTPRLPGEVFAMQRRRQGESLLFPNLFPYGAYSAVSLFDERHFVEIGRASEASYRDSFINSAAYLGLVQGIDPQAIYMAITQNHLPSAGGSLVHPHLQVNADRIPTNHQDYLARRTQAYFVKNECLLFSDYLQQEKEEGRRYIGTTGPWHWLAAYAPEGFFEIWGLLPGVTSLLDIDPGGWAALAQGVLCTQKYYRSLNRNGYNLGLIGIEKRSSKLELRVSLMVRANYAPWVRSDHTGFEVMLGDMATFTAPEETARQARPFFPDQP